MSDETLEMENSSDSSAEETSSENVTEDDKKSETKTVPYERFKEVNDELKRIKSQVKPVQVERQEQSKQPLIDESWKQWMEFTIENKELDKEQLITAKRLFESGTPLSKVLEDPLYVAFSEKHQREKQEKASTTVSGRSPKVPSEKPLKDMTDEEHKEHFKKYQGR